MALKLIDVERIESVRVSYQNLQGQLDEDTDKLVKSSASEAFREATAKAIELSSELTVTVESLDEFMNAAAREFRAVDDSIARVIGGGNLETFKGSGQASRSAYNELSGQTQKQVDHAKRYLYNDYPY